MNCDPTKACLHIKNCMVLHNIGIDRNDIIPTEDDDQEHDEGLDMDINNGNDNPDGKAMRAYITNRYFNN